MVPVVPVESLGSGAAPVMWRIVGRRAARRVPHAERHAHQLAPEGLRVAEPSRAGSMAVDGIATPARVRDDVHVDPAGATDDLVDDRAAAQGAAMPRMQEAVNA